MLDLEPAAKRLADLVAAVDDTQLSAPTPCVQMTIGDLCQHIDDLALAFTCAAKKKSPEEVLSEGGSDPEEDWQRRIQQRLTALASAWNDEGAWSGMTEAGGMKMPGEVAGTVAIDEVVVHGWDLAVASGQEFSAEPQLVEAAYGFAEESAAENPEGTPGLFGPPQPVSDNAPLLNRLIAMTGRDPEWRAS